MNSKIVSIILILIVVVIGFFAINREEGDSIADQNITPTQNVDSTSTTTPAAQPGSYEPYAPEKLAKAATGDVVLFFRASWCPTCRALDADIRANAAKIPANLTILDVDYDNSTALKQKHGVTYQHTMVQVDAAGNQLAKWTNSPTLADMIIRVR